MRCAVEKMRSQYDVNVYFCAIKDDAQVERNSKSETQGIKREIASDPLSVSLPLPRILCHLNMASSVLKKKN